MKDLHLFLFVTILQFIPTNSSPWITRNELNTHLGVQNVYTGHGLFAPGSNIYPGSYHSPSNTEYKPQANVYGRNTYQTKPSRQHFYSNQKHYQNTANMKHNVNSYSQTPNGYRPAAQSSTGNYGNTYSQSKPPLKRFGKPQKKKFYWPYFPYSASDYGNPLYKKGNEHKKETYDKGVKYKDVPYDGPMNNFAKKAQTYSRYL